MKTIDIWLLVYPGFVLLDATGPAQVFASANDEACAAGLPPPYRLQLIAPRGGLVCSTAGISLQAQPLPRRSLAGATLIVAGGRSADGAAPQADAVTLRWLRRVAQRAGSSVVAAPGHSNPALQRCCAVCTGAFLLAQAGLLDGRRAVTHWLDVAALQAQYPALQVHDDAIYVRDGAYYTSAGIAAGMDLALALVEQDLGAAAALATARRLVLPYRRAGGQRQFSTELQLQAAPDGVATRLADWLRARLALVTPVSQMAAALAMSERSLHRHLRAETGLTPAQLLLQLRLDHACRLLEQGRVSVKQLARQTGFGSAYNLRRAFVARLGVLPGAYAERFGSQIPLQGADNT